MSDTNDPTIPNPVRVIVRRLVYVQRKSATALWTWVYRAVDLHSRPIFGDRLFGASISEVEILVGETDGPLYVVSLEPVSNGLAYAHDEMAENRMQKTVGRFDSVWSSTEYYDDSLGREGPVDPNIFDGSLAGKGQELLYGSSWLNPERVYPTLCLVPCLPWPSKSVNSEN